MAKDGSSISDSVIKVFGEDRSIERGYQILSFKNMRVHLN